MKLTSTPYSTSTPGIQSVDGSKRFNSKTHTNFTSKRRATTDICENNNKPTFVRRPRTLVCYICGREYGIASLAIHVKACIKKFEIQESLKPPG